MAYVKLYPGPEALGKHSGSWKRNRVKLEIGCYQFALLLCFGDRISCIPGLKFTIQWRMILNFFYLTSAGVTGGHHQTLISEFDILIEIKTTMEAS